MTDDTPPASPADMAAFGASDAACYLYPGADQQAERAAFCEGAAHAVSTPPASPAITTSQQERTMAERPVLVTTEFCGVFFGYAEDTSGDTITLTRARNCIYWPSGQGGFMGLASEGPAKGARIGATVEKIELRKVTSVTEVSETAAQKWQGANVYRG